MHQDEKTSVIRQHLLVLCRDKLNADIVRLYSDRIPTEGVQDLSSCHFKLVQAACLNQHEGVADSASLLRSLCVMHDLEWSLVEQIQVFVVRALAKRLAARRQSRTELLSVSLPIVMDVASVIASALRNKAARKSTMSEMADELS